ncbi:hypothetical protein GCM10010981_01390 [Dyella nitratireducens]|uniref:Uncharacterized protein n=1 Tax=Dyella nitratireducens TaxID=1849580 RepID=A0ABQ1FIT6_9GAMM|nr:hypothetical protein GCM10010981_01390 [Dyella nitratireducens]GLQ44800.1 hypothetical protein GCM10007902_46500 [Dyella nitratireducens]
MLTEQGTADEDGFAVNAGHTPAVVTQIGNGGFELVHRLSWENLGCRIAYDPGEDKEEKKAGLTGLASRS